MISLDSFDMDLLGEMLTKQDVERLLYDPSHQVRAELANRMGAEFSKNLFQGPQRAMVLEIFHLLSKDAELHVRRSLSAALHHASELPQSIINTILNDVDDIAHDFLRNAFALSEDDLIEIVKAAERMAVLAAIAQRETLSMPLAASLIAREEELVTANVVANPGAALDERMIYEIIEKYANQESIIGALVERGGLPLKVVDKLIISVSGPMRSKLVNRYNLNSDTVQKFVGNTLDLTALSILPRKVDEENLSAMLSQMHANERLTPTLMIRALCNGDLDYFECAVAVRANVPIVNARKLLSDKGALGFRAIYSVAHMPESFIEMVRGLYQFANDTIGRQPITVGAYHKRLLEEMGDNVLKGAREHTTYLTSLLQDQTRDPSSHYH